VAVLSTGRVLGAVVGIYAAQSIVGGLVFQSVPAVLRQQGQPLGLIGLVWLLMLIHALKFLWSPAVESLRLRPDGTRHSRHIILSGQLATALLLAVLAMAGTDTVTLFAILALATIATATVDIACDAFAVEQLPRQARGWGNAMQVGGAYLGIMLGGGGFLIAVGRFGWEPAAMAIAACMVVFAIPLLLTPEPLGDAARQAAHRPSLRDALRRPAFRIGLLTVLAAQIALRIGYGMLGPFLIDRGFDLETLGWLTGLGGTLAGLAGTIVAATILAHHDVGRVLRLAVATQGVIFILLAAAAMTPDLPREALMALPLLLGFIAGASFVVLYSAMMGWATGPQPGVDYALLQSADAALAAIAGMSAGLLGQFIGIDACFVLAAALALVMAVLLPGLARRAERGA
jgi:MFS transporter (putative signal transducer)